MDVENFRNLIIKNTFCQLNEQYGTEDPSVELFWIQEFSRPINLQYELGAVGYKVHSVKHQLTIYHAENNLGIRMD